MNFSFHLAISSKSCALDRAERCLFALCNMEPYELEFYNLNQSRWLRPFSHLALLSNVLLYSTPTISISPVSIAISSSRSSLEFIEKK